MLPNQTLKNRALPLEVSNFKSLYGFDFVRKVFETPDFCILHLLFALE